MHPAVKTSRFRRDSPVGRQLLRSGTGMRTAGRGGRLAALSAPSLARRYPGSRVLASARCALVPSRDSVLWCRESDCSNGPAASISGAAECGWRRDRSARRIQYAATIWNAVMDQVARLGGVDRSDVLFEMRAAVFAVQ